MSHQTAKALSDVVPGHQGPFSAVVVRFADALYNLSVQKKPVLPQNSEVARQHICAYLAAEKYHERLDMATPSLNMIPVPPKVAMRVIDEFRNSLMGELSTPSSSPASTPRGKRTTIIGSGGSKSPQTPSGVSTSPSGSPRRIGSATPHKSSPLKRLRETAQDEDGDFRSSKRTQKNFRDVESPFNPKTKDTTLPERDLESPTPPILDDAAYKAQYRSEKRQMSLGEFVSMCNHFYIPADITAQMLQTFVAQRHRFAKKSEWLLACGMVHAAYVRINHRLLRLKMGARSLFQNQLFQYQVGGLARWNMLLWCNIVDNTLKDEPWINSIENTYVYNNSTTEKAVRLREVEAKAGPHGHLMARFGAIIDACDMSYLPQQDEYYNRWTARAKQMVGVEDSGNK